MKLICDFNKLLEDLGLKTPSQKIVKPDFSMSSRKPRLFLLNSNEKGGPLLETLT